MTIHWTASWAPRVTVTIRQPDYASFVIGVNSSQISSPLLLAKGESSLTGVRLTLGCPKHIWALSDGTSSFSIPPFSGEIFSKNLGRKETVGVHVIHVSSYSALVLLVTWGQKCASKCVSENMDDWSYTGLVTTVSGLKARFHKMGVISQKIVSQKIGKFRKSILFTPALGHITVCVSVIQQYCYPKHQNGRLSKLPYMESHLTRCQDLKERIVIRKTKLQSNYEPIKQYDIHLRPTSERHAQLYCWCNGDSSSFKSHTVFNPTECLCPPALANPRHVVTASRP
jgi:hypothetical protein